MNEIFTRRSVRKYADKPVEKEKVEKLLRRAMQAPSATNQQPWEFIVVDDKELLKKLSSFSPYSKFVADAPLAMVLLNRTDFVLRVMCPGTWALVWKICFCRQLNWTLVRYGWAQASVTKETGTLQKFLTCRKMLNLSLLFRKVTRQRKTPTNLMKDMTKAVSTTINIDYLVIF